MQTAWIPLRNGGANFQTNKLHQTSPTRWEFRATASIKWFSALFIVIGMGVAAFAANRHFMRPPEGAWNIKLLFLPGFGLVFMLAGSVLAYTSTVPTVFDKDRGYYVKNRCGTPFWESTPE